ncbi:hypothetical protein [Micromonospora sp. bgisy143]|uniref:hypothetical protein n=1 Tax=Micromonospora sp. bgisy143 TaxID=3413790 RepID=UPI003EBBB8C8
MDDGPITPALVLWTAKRVITQHATTTSPHRANGMCVQCCGAGCNMLSWAIDVVKAHRLATIPEP